MLTYDTNFTPENRGNMDLWNVDNTAHIHTVRRTKSTPVIYHLESQKSAPLQFSLRLNMYHFTETYKGLDEQISAHFSAALDDVTLFFIHLLLYLR
jgi:hypothetical protein